MTAMIEFSRTASKHASEGSFSSSNATSCGSSCRLGACHVEWQEHTIKLLSGHGLPALSGYRISLPVCTAAGAILSGAEALYIYMYIGRSGNPVSHLHQLAYTSLCMPGLRTALRSRGGCTRGLARALCAFCLRTALRSRCGCEVAFVGV